MYNVAIIIKIWQQISMASKAGVMKAKYKSKCQRKMALIERMANLVA
jgi:hypothetical protein